MQTTSNINRVENNSIVWGGIQLFVFVLLLQTETVFIPMQTTSNINRSIDIASGLHGDEETHKLSASPCSRIVSTLELKIILLHEVAFNSMFSTLESIQYTLDQ